VLIVSYEKAQELVKLNKNLYWNGWDIMEWREDSLGEMSKDGILMNGKWGLAKNYKLNEDGWDVPSKYVR
jgi:hypothetical protein